MEQLLNIGLISTDSRTISKGEVFVALCGENFDGHDYIQQALDKGAGGLLLSNTKIEDIKNIKNIKKNNPQVSVVLVEDTLLALGQLAKKHRNKYSLPIIGITGSCGKTTIKNMLNSILSMQSKVLASPGSCNNEIGLPQTLLNLNSRHNYAVLEMGAKNKGDIAYLMNIAMPAISIVSNAGSAHLASMKSLDEVAKIKGEAYENLSADGVAIINIDDHYASYWQGLLTKQRVITFGINSMADITCAYLLVEPDKTVFELVTDIGSIQVSLPLLGTHNIMNALAAAASARALGVLLDDIKNGLERLRPCAGRLQIKIGAHGEQIIDDSYNANPVSMQAALSVLTSTTGKRAGKKILVMGDMLELGDTAEVQHKIIGESAKKLGINKLLGVGNLTKFAVNSFGKNARHYSNKNDLIDDLMHIVGRDTTVLIKGSNAMRMNEIADLLQVNN